MALTNTQLDVTKLYLAAFLRAPELGGLNYWNGNLAAGQSLKQVGQTIFALDVVKAIYPDAMTNSAFVGAIYQNVFGKAADAQGLAFWTGRMNAGETRGELAMDMINAGLGVPDGTPGKAYIAGRYQTAQYQAERQLTQGAEAPIATLKSLMAEVDGSVATVGAANGSVDWLLRAGAAGANQGAVAVDVYGQAAASPSGFNAAAGSYNFVLDGSRLRAGEQVELQVAGYGADDSITVRNLAAVSAYSDDDGTADLAVAGLFFSSPTVVGALAVTLVGLNPGRAQVTSIAAFNALAVGDASVFY